MATDTTIVVMGDHAEYAPTSGPGGSGEKLGHFALAGWTFFAFAFLYVPIVVLILFSFNSARTQARPIPDAAPVTAATLPDNDCRISNPPIVAGIRRGREKRASGERENRR